MLVGEQRDIYRTRNTASSEFTGRPDVNERTTCSDELSNIGNKPLGKHLKPHRLAIFAMIRGPGITPIEALNELGSAEQ